MLWLVVAAAIAGAGGTIEHYWHTVPLERDMAAMERDVALAVTVSAQAQLDEIAKHAETKRKAGESRDKNNRVTSVAHDGLIGLRIDSDCGSFAPTRGETEANRDSRTRLLLEQMASARERLQRGTEADLLRAEGLNNAAREANAAAGLEE
jgi:hypothetical protein